MKRKSDNAASKKASVSMATILWDFIDEEKVREGHTSASACVADLVRQRRRERELVSVGLSRLLTGARTVSSNEAEELFARAERLADAGQMPSKPKSPPHRGTSGRTSGGNA